MRKAQQFARVFSFCLSGILLLSNIKTCQRFEPELLLELATDSFEILPGIEYKISGSVLSFGEDEIIQHGFCWSEENSPTTTDSTTKLGGRNLKGSFTSTISSLSTSTKYYVRSYATNIVGANFYGNELEFTTGDYSVSDIEGNVYPTTIIGAQEWMAENLKTATYADGSAIAEITDSSTWDAMGYSDKAYCWYNNDFTTGETYGALYTWAAAMNGLSTSISNPSGIQGVCPDGWHLPSDSEWKQLEVYLGMNPSEADLFGYRGTQGGQLKETGFVHWFDPNGGAVNTTDFTALPGGYRYSDGFFDCIGEYGLFWSATEASAKLGMSRSLGFYDTYISRGGENKDDGISVRCVKD